jgi:hypothetical protein
MRSGATAAILVAAAVAVGAGCGERKFDAEELVDALNEQGAELTLGDRIAENEAGDPVYAIKFTPGGDPNPQLESEGGGGTLVVADDDGAANVEFDRCESAGDLTCFRAANTVMRFDEMAATDRARISGAVSALAAPTG